MIQRSREAFATLCAGKDRGYLQGALALRRSLLEAGSDKDFVVLLDETFGAEDRHLLERGGCRVEPIAPVTGESVKRAAALCPWFQGVFGKLRVWELTEYSKIAFLDADTIVLKNLDHLFSTPGLVAAPDASCTDQFNAGFFICEPSRETAAHLAAFLKESEAWDGGDQSVLNQFFDGWYRQPAPPRLPFAYNHQAGRIPADAAARERVAVAHFYGMNKPWVSGSPDRGSNAVSIFLSPGFARGFERGVQPLLFQWNALAGARRPAPPLAARRGRSRTAFATVLIHESQLAAALALKGSLDATNPGHPVVALLPPSVAPSVAAALERSGVSVRRAPWVVPPGRVPLATAASLVRLRLWQLTEYGRVVYLAPTVAALQDVSDLFERPAFAAAPRGQRPDRFLSDVLVLEPSQDVFTRLATHAARSGAPTFERCLHGFFSDWYELPAEHRLPQRDAFELEAFLYLGHTTLLRWMLERGLLRLLDCAPFVFEQRWLLTPDPTVEADRALEVFRAAVSGGERSPAADGADVAATETWLNQEPYEPGWAFRIWTSKWEACQRDLGLGRFS